MTETPSYASHDINGNALTTEESEALTNRRKSQVSLGGSEKMTWRTNQAETRFKQALWRIQELVESSPWRRINNDSFDRQAAIIQMSNKEQEEWAKRIGTHNLRYQVLQYTKPSNGFSHRTRKAHPSNPNRVARAVVAKSEEDIERVVNAHNNKPATVKNEIYGDLFGYPDCCIDFFNQMWVENQLRDPIYEMACNTDTIKVIDDHGDALQVGEVQPWCNVLWRYWGWSLLDHIPCSFDCEESMAQAKTKFEWIKNQGYEEEAMLLKEWLEEPTEWSGKTGLGRVSNKYALSSASTSWYWNKKTVIWRDNPVPVNKSHSNGEN